MSTPAPAKTKMADGLWIRDVRFPMAHRPVEHDTSLDSLPLNQACISNRLSSCRRKKMADGLWMRARQAGAWTELERRSYGVADDVYSAGLLVAYMAFVPFCAPGSVDGPTIQVQRGT